MKFIIATQSDPAAVKPRKYYLEKKGREHYTWHLGEPGRRRAERFRTRAEAQTVIDGGFRDCAGMVAEVLEIES